MNSGSFFGKHWIKTFFKVLTLMVRIIIVTFQEDDWSTRSELRSCLEIFVQQKNDKMMKNEKRKGGKEKKKK